MIRIVSELYHGCIPVKTLHRPAICDKMFFAVKFWPKDPSGAAFYTIRPQHEEVYSMAKCEVCSKGQHFGLLVSHSNHKTNHAWKPNVKKVHLEVDGQSKSMNICARCLRASRMTKSV